MGHTLQIPSQLSSHLRALRKAKGWTQAELGKQLGLSQTRVARIEGDPLSISVDRLLSVLAALGVSVTLEPLTTVKLTGIPITTSAGTVTPTRAPAAKEDQADW